MGSESKESESRAGNGESLTAARHQRLTEALHLQALEANPLLPGEVAMFAMFEREGWTADDRRAYIAKQFKPVKQPVVVE